MDRKLGWIHLEHALPLLGEVDLPRLLALLAKGADLLDGAGKTIPSLSKVMAVLTPDLLAEVQYLGGIVGSTRVLRKLCAIAIATADELLNAEVDESVMRGLEARAARMAPTEVLKSLGFFTGRSGRLISEPLGSSGADLDPALVGAVTSDTSDAS